MSAFDRVLSNRLVIFPVAESGVNPPKFGFLSLSELAANLPNAALGPFAKRPFESR